MGVVGLALFDALSGLVCGLWRVPASVGGSIWFTFSMHFGSYLTTAALVLMGLQVLYALYQLASFVL